MISRRGFLGALLAAAAAPAIVRASSLMPIQAPKIIVPNDDFLTLDHATDALRYLMQGEVGRYEGFRFIEQREIPRNVGDTIKFRRYQPMSADDLNRAWRRMEEGTAFVNKDAYLGFVHPSFAADLRRAGIPVKRSGR